MCTKTTLKTKHSYLLIYFVRFLPCQKVNWRSFYERLFDEAQFVQKKEKNAVEHSVHQYLIKIKRAHLQGNCFWEAVCYRIR